MNHFRGIVALSKPRNANSVNVAVAGNGEKIRRRADVEHFEIFRLHVKQSTTETNISGRIFSIVVISCTAPASLTPIVLIQERNHTAPSPVATARTEFVAKRRNEYRGIAYERNSFAALGRPNRYPNIPMRRECGKVSQSNSCGMRMVHPMHWELSC